MSDAPNTDWMILHNRAMREPRTLFERAIVSLVNGLEEYRRAHYESYDTGIGEDHVLGEHWADIARGIIGLLNGETGRLDCGTIDAGIRGMLRDEDFSDDF